jgi:acyl-CoA reductase-like NAD-dependent aldehyde dehydrogenase
MRCLFLRPIPPSILYETPCHHETVHQELLINGVFIGGPCDQSIGKTQHSAPYDDKLVGTAAEAGWSEVTAAIDAAETAYESWQFSSPNTRADLLHRVASLVRERFTELAELMAKEIGKPITQAEAEVTRVAITFELAAKLALQNHTREIDISQDSRSQNLHVTSTRVPVGPILAIVPYNWPLNLAAHKIAPALAAGNTVVVKTPSMGALCTLALGRIIHEAGCPDGVVNVLNTVPALTQKAALDPRIRLLSFTGSPQVGWMLKELLPKKRVSLELGGDATAVIAPDADIEDAVQKLVPGAFAYAGQICISLQHILCHESQYQEFREKFTRATESVRTGNPMDRTVTCGPLITTEAADKALELIEDAETHGATLLSGGHRIGNIIEPAIIENPTRKMRIGIEEAFAPLVTLQSYSTDDQAIHWINSSQFGIHAALFTQDHARIQTYFNELEIGGLIINNTPSLRFDAMPYGGVKNSGFGREGVANTFHEMTEDKVLIQTKS